jgi:HYR domain.
MVQETIATFARDCTTPKSAFVLGETVCAKTDNVDLNFPGGRWVHWLRQDLSIAFGGSGTTDITTNPQTFTFVPDQLGTWKVTIAETGDISQTPAAFTVSAAAPLATYESDCATPKSTFALGDTVCAKLVGTPALRSRLAILNTAGFTLASADITNDPQTVSFTLPTAATEFFGDQNVDNRGTWNVNQVDSSDATVRAAIDFFVTDPAEEVADISSSSILLSDTQITPGSDVNFGLFVLNKGPNAAANVRIVDTVPDNTTFVSVVQNSGPTFNCVTPGAGNVGTTTCSRASLAAGDLAEFSFTYRVDTGVAEGTTITHTVDTRSDTADSNTLDNTSIAGSDIPTGTTAEACHLSCRADLVVTADTTQGAVEGKFVTFASTDQITGNCGPLTTSPAPGSFFPVGTTPVHVTSDVGEGSCSFNVIVTTIAAPTIACPQDVTVNVTAGETSANVNPGTPSTVPATGVTVTFDRSDDDDDPETPQLPLNAPYPLGVTNIDWTVRDASGRTATCAQRIVVQVETRPVLTISCPATVNGTATSCNAGVNVSIGTPTTNPSDSNVEVTATRSDGAALTDPYPVGDTQVVWTATDNVNGNVANCTQIVHVTSPNDNTPPTLHVPGPITTSTSSCSVVLDDELGVATAEDNCSSSVNISRTGVPANFRFPTGTTIITYTATDASGNSTTGTQTVTVNESPAIAPVISCPSNITVTLPLNSTATSMAVNFPTPTATDNCSTPTVTTDIASGSIFPVGTTTVTVTATDAAGNTSHCQFTVTVLYNFFGFFAPVDNLPVLNVVTAGKGVPVKFSLSGNKGLSIFAANSPSSMTINCDGSAPQDDIEETVNAGGSSLSYTATSDQYNYVWKTENSWKNTCRQLVLKLNDGTEHRANFKFK